MARRAENEKGFRMGSDGLLDVPSTRKRAMRWFVSEDV
jgi:hypothetical protein